MRAERGFTLIEVIVALMVLMSALTILLGLQSSVMQRAIRDMNAQRAVLAAREILTLIESSPEPPPLEQTIAGAGELISSLSQGRELPGGISVPPDLTAELVVTDWGIPDLNPQAMRRVDLRVAWGPALEDAISTTLFIPNAEQIEEDEVEADEDDA